MIKISKLTDYAFLVLCHLENVQGEQNVRDISRAISLPGPTVAKVCKALTRNGLIESKRGAEGGYSLSVSLEGISVGRVIEAFEGPVTLTACVDHSKDKCALEDSCAMAGRWTPLNNEIRDLLYETSLRDMIAQEMPLSKSSEAEHNQIKESLGS